MLTFWIDLSDRIVFLSKFCKSSTCLPMAFDNLTITVTAVTFPILVSQIQMLLA